MVLLLPASMPEAAWADIQTVTATQATQMARTLPKQEVDKGGVWKVFIGGAVTLFLTTLALENNSSLFPAIARANQAAKDAKKASEVRGSSSNPACMHPNPRKEKRLA